MYNLRNDYRNKEYEVDLDNPDCCFYVHTHNLPCRHMLVVFFATGLLGTRRQVAQCLEKYWPKWACAHEYVRMYQGRCIRAPPLYTGPSTGPVTDHIGAPVQSATKRGRPKKERHRYKPKTVKTVEERMPIVYNAEFGAALRWM